MGKKEKSTLPNARNVLFVCNGNSFRSFSAEFLLKHYLDIHNAKGWNVFSAGMIKNRNKVDPETIVSLRAFGIAKFHRAHHLFNKSLLKKFDLVIAMAQDQVDNLRNNFNYPHAILFNELVKDEKSSIWDVEDDVKDYATNRNKVKKKIDKTIKYIHDSIPDLVEGINQRVYLFSDFAKGLERREHKNGFPVIRLYETPHTLAFMSISIPSKEDGHILIIPKKRYVYFHEIPSKILSELLHAVQKIGAVLDRDHGGYNVLLNNGRAAGQYIFHAHFHLLPRDDKDQINLNGWSDKKMTLRQFVVFNKKLREKISNFAKSSKIN